MGVSRESVLDAKSGGGSICWLQPNRQSCSVLSSCIECLKLRSNQEKALWLKAKLNGTTWHKISSAIFRTVCGFVWNSPERPSCLFVQSSGCWSILCSLYFGPLDTTRLFALSNTLTENIFVLLYQLTKKWSNPNRPISLLPVE